ncbi:hypothetical protein MFM001_00460 [Mycobacterium sp. MFM001]|nr:hypothetical protein MFM001_00460 [Mycobacterium sp. MFM001]
MVAHETVDFAARDTSMSAYTNVVELAAVTQIGDMLARDAEQPSDFTCLKHCLHGTILLHKHKKHNAPVSEVFLRQYTLLSLA